MLSVSTLDLASHVSNIVGVLEESCDGFFALVDGLNVLLGGFLLLGQFLDSGGHFPTLIQKVLEGSQVVEFSLDPVIEVGEGVSEVLQGVEHRLFKRALWTVDDHLAGVQVSVVSQVQVLVVCEDFGGACVALHDGLLLAEEASEVGFQLLEEGLNLLDEDCELGDLGLISVCGHGVEVLLVEPSALLKSISVILRGQFWHLGEVLLHIKTLRSGEELELL